MRKMRLQPKWKYVLAVPVLAVLVLAACSGGGEPLGSAGPTETPTTAPTIAQTPTPAGFLPIPTLTPMPESGLSGHLGPCPPLPLVACAEPGDRVNVYQGLLLEGAIGLSGVQRGVGKWVRDSAQVQRVLRELDRDVVLAPYAISRTGAQDRMGLSIRWRKGEGLPWGEISMDEIVFVIDADTGVIGHDRAHVQWPLPAGFVDLLLTSLSDVTPTPRPTTAPTPTIVPPGAVFFNHPDGELLWDGPDERVSSVGEAHCGSWGNLKRDYGIPAAFHVEDGPSFWGGPAVRREDGWRWTGYYHGDWQIWQGDDARTAYVVHAGERRIAFQYRATGCD